MLTLPRDARTGLEAIAVLPSGRVVWPIRGGDGTEDDPPAGTGDGGKPSGDLKGGDADKGDADTDWASEAAKWKALARKHEDQAKANATAAKRLRELEDADKSELQKIQERAAELERKAEEAEVRALRAEIAFEKGLPPALAKRLVGKDRSAMETDADELLAALAPGDDKSRGPREKAKPGAVPSAEPEETDPRKLAALVPRN
jgi:hypothetical protein